jgi:hypothetical protein
MKSLLSEKGESGGIVRDRKFQGGNRKIFLFLRFLLVKVYLRGSKALGAGHGCRVV